MKNTTKLNELDAIFDQVEAIKTRVFKVREPGEEKLLRAQRLLSEVRDLLLSAHDEEVARQIAESKA